MNQRVSDLNGTSKHKNTQTVGGDNEFILELRDIEILNKQSILLNLQQKIELKQKRVDFLIDMVKPILVEGSDAKIEFKFVVEQNLDPLQPLHNIKYPWTIEAMVWSAYHNTSVIDDEPNKILSDLKYKSYSSIRTILNTIQPRCINALN